MPTATAVVVARSPKPPAALPPLPPVDSSARIGLQVGHWRIEELPVELSRLRGASGGSGGGIREVDLNLEIVQRLAERLRGLGYTVDILPAAVPPGYTADVFLSVHADASTSGTPRGYKVARSRWTRLRLTDDALVETLANEYGAVTGLPRSDAITRNMTGYYAFNNHRRAYAIDKSTPGAIFEMGYLTNPLDRAFLTEQSDRVVDGLARGLVRFLAERPPPDEREPPASTDQVIVIGGGGASARAAPRLDAPVLVTLPAGRRQDAPEIVGEWYGVWVTEVNGPGWVHRSQATVETVQLP